MNRSSRDLNDVIDDFSLGSRCSHPCTSGMFGLILGLWRLREALPLLFDDTADLEKFIEDIHGARSTMELARLFIDECKHLDSIDANLLEATIKEKQAMLVTLRNCFGTRTR